MICKLAEISPPFNSEVMGAYNLDVCKLWFPLLDYLNGKYTEVTYADGASVDYIGKNVSNLADIVNLPRELDCHKSKVRIS